MKIVNSAIAGTLESSDVQIMLSPLDDAVEISLDSPVKKQFGKHIEQVVLDVLASYHIDSVAVSIVDKGALDCVIKARLKTAINRSFGHQHVEKIWEDDFSYE